MFLFILSTNKNLILQIRHRFAIKNDIENNNTIKLVDN